MSTAAVTRVTGRKQGHPFYFPQGLPGLEDFRKFYVEPIPDNRLFCLLQSVEEDQVGLILVDPFPFFPDYGVELLENDKRDLELATREDLLLFTTVTFGEEQMFTNLAAPILINVKQKRGKQIIIPQRTDQMRSPLAVRHQE